MSGLVLTGGKVISDGVIQPATVCVDGGKITGVFAPEEPLDPARRHEIRVDGCYIAPGFIDLLAHGGLGVDFFQGPDPKITRYFGQHGTTGILAGLRSAPLEHVLHALRTIGSGLPHPPEGGAQILGVHVESVYYNPEWCGAQSAKTMRRPDVEEVLALVEASQSSLKMVSIAPELPGALPAIAALTEVGVRVSIGHTDATPELMDAAIRAGATMVTHLFNATGGPFYKEAGVRALDVSTFALTRKALVAQVIADGIHVDPDLVMLTYRAKGPDGIAFITDASSMAGLPDGHYTGSDGRQFVLADGSCRLVDGRLAASRLTLDKAVENAVSWGIPLADAVHMASFVPARTIGLDHRKGRISQGYDADLAILTEDLQVKQTVIAGKLV